ncbi:MAG TPA: fatty acyl-AMP ligase [Pseudonocardiaceae bacterium]|nr:fatty acyl-AMP ligase [Pseudonocardiaceae bacterium]
MSAVLSDLPRQSLPAVLDARAAAQPDRLAFRFLADGTGESAVDWTYRDLADRAASVAAELIRRGTAGERVVLALEPGLDYIAALFGIFAAGAVAVPSFPPVGKRASARFRSIIDDCAPRLVIASMSTPDGTQRLSAAELYGGQSMTPGRLAEPALLQYTSGSTGEPKGVMVSHANLVANCLAMAANLGDADPRRVSCSWLPPYHDMGLIGAILLPVFCGFPMVVLSPVHFVQQPYRWLKAISDNAVTTSVAPNFALDLCVDAVTDDELRTLDLRPLRHLFCGAEPLRQETLDRFERRFAPAGYSAQAMVPCFGMAEATLFVSGRDRRRPVTRLWLDKDALARGTVRIDEGADAVPVVSCGVVAGEHEVVVVDPETRRPAAPGVVGELWIRGPSVAAGYFGRPELTAEAFAATRADTPGDRYLRTGDLGFVHDGELYLTGRLKDLIIVAGRNHYPQDIEATVHRAYPEARRVAAFPVSRGGGDELVIVVETRRPANWPELSDAIRAAVTGMHGISPADIHFGPSGTVAVTTSGKLQRATTRNSYLRGTIKDFRATRRNGSYAQEATSGVDRL